MQCHIVRTQLWDLSTCQVFQLWDQLQRINHLIKSNPSLSILRRLNPADQVQLFPIFVGDFSILHLYQLWENRWTHQTDVIKLSGASTHHSCHIYPWLYLYSCLIYSGEINLQVLYVSQVSEQFYTAGAKLAALKLWKLGLDSRVWVTWRSQRPDETSRWWRILQAYSAHKWSKFPYFEESEQLDKLDHIAI